MVCAKRENAGIGKGGSPRNYLTKASYLNACAEAVRINEGMQSYIDFMKGSMPLSKEQVLGLMHKAQTGNDRAKERLVQNFMPRALCKAVEFCKEWNAENCLEDMFQQLVEHIHHTMLTYTLDTKSEVTGVLDTGFHRIAKNVVFSSGNGKYYVPSAVVDKIYSLSNDFRQQGWSLEDKVAVIEYCVNELGYSKEQGECIFSCLQNPVALEEAEEILAAEYDCEEDAGNEERNEQITDLLKNLKAREAFVVKHRYGFEGLSPKTLEEIGQMMGLTRERIRQIEKRALHKLRIPLRRAGYGAGAC